MARTFAWIPIIILNSSEVILDSPMKSYAIGDTVVPFAAVDFTNIDFGGAKHDHGWKARIALGVRDRAALSASTARTNYLETSDPQVLQSIAQHWRFIYTGGGTTSAESVFRLDYFGHPMFRCSIVIDTATQGLYSQQFGWITPLNDYNLVADISMFKPSYCLIVFM